MARIFYVHGKDENELDAVRALRSTGHVVRCHADCGPQSCAFLAEWAPELLVVSLKRQPTEGPHWTSLVKVASDMAAVPLVFTGGPAAVLETARGAFPAAKFCPTKEISGRVEGLLRSDEVTVMPTPAARVAVG